MHDGSLFMKLYEQKVTMYYNKKHQTFGTLWADRFKSQLVEDGGIALQTVAVYIDLNGVRARLAQDPKDYRFCGYAEAVAGNVELQRQYARTMAGELISSGWLSGSTHLGEKQDYWTLFTKMNCLLGRQSPFRNTAFPGLIPGLICKPQTS
jgi:hypothetical protein